MSRQRPLHKIQPAPDDSTLIDRNQARLELGRVCYTTIIRAERAGKLTPITLTDVPKAKVFYRLAEVRALSGKPMHEPPVIKGKVLEYGGKKYVAIDQDA